MNEVIVQCAKVLAWMFFVGISGCLVVVIISWISIFKSGFSRDNSDEPASFSGIPAEEPERKPSPVIAQGIVFPTQLLSGK